MPFTMQRSGADLNYDHIHSFLLVLLITQLGVITGHGICSCGRCVCQEGWFGKLCQYSRKCNMTEEESRSLCESADGVLCSGKGSCHCGKCICSPQEWYISGDFCECDDRDCDKHDGLICTGAVQANS
ncbi:integrin beta-like protein 1 [Meleagris gallopavo]|uniref:integrin beta-like protein 1 n=1 Tax=Meleagris gallopavo TaxID=9103 RepID=UPI00093B39B3|nr:integrin beta-like protein 1 [Meleagris gallopavo]